MIAELIRTFHAQKKLPVFNFVAHQRLLAAEIDNFDVECITAVRRFADANDFLVVFLDYEHKCKFAPRNKPSDYSEWIDVEFGAKE